MHVRASVTCEDDTMNQEKIKVVAIAALIVWVSWLVRYDVHQRSVAGPPVIVMLDRWTRSVYVSFGHEWKEIM